MNVSSARAHCLHHLQGLSFPWWSLAPAITFAFLGLAGPAAHAEKVPALSPPELDALEGIERRMAESGPDHLPPLVAEALAAAELGRDERCRKAIGDVARGSAGARAMAALNAVQTCHLAVWEAFGRAANRKGTLVADPAFVAACDEKGRDQVFTGQLASWRAEMEPGHYALFRSLLPELRAALSKDGSSRARGVWSAIDRRLPALAAQLIAMDREAHPVAVAHAPPGFDHLRDAEKAQVKRAGAPLVAVSAGAVSFDGSDVGRVESLLRKKEPAAWKLALLANRLERWRKDFVERHPSASARDRIVLRPDGDVVYEVLARVIYTATESGFPVIDFAVPLRNRGFHRVRWSGQVPAPLVLALSPAPSRVEWEDEPGVKRVETADDKKGVEQATTEVKPAVSRPGASRGADQPHLRVEAGALVVKSRAGAQQRVVDVDGKADEEGLRKALSWLRKAHGAALAVSVDDEVRYSRLLWVLDVARDAGFDGLRLAVEAPVEGIAVAVAGATMATVAGATTGTATGAGTPATGSADLSDLGAAMNEKPKGPPVVVDVEPVKVEGELSTEGVGKAIEGHLPEVRACYAAELGKVKGLAGRVVLQLLVGGGGAVSKALVSSSTLRNAAVEQCAVKAALGWLFPMTDSGVAAIVTAPFSLHLAKK